MGYGGTTFNPSGAGNGTVPSYVDPTGYIGGKIASTLGFGPGPGWSPQQAATMDQAAYQRRIAAADASINCFNEAAA